MMVGNELRRGSKPRAEKVHLSMAGVCGRHIHYIIPPCAPELPSIPRIHDSRLHQNLIAMSYLRSLIFSLFLISVSGKSLVSYNAAAGDAISKLGLLDLEGWARADWPSRQAQNSSLYFQTGAKDPDGVAAAHVHKSARQYPSL